MVARSYNNADTQKPEILKENNGKSGVYMLINLINNKTYVGSAVNLKIRFYNYYSIAYITRSYIPLCKALLKYGYSNFSLVILEYCKEEDVIVKENYYFKLLTPEYNILQFARSSKGYIHTEEAKKKMSAMRKLRKQDSEDTRSKRSLSNPLNIKVEVTDIENNTTIVYHSMGEVARTLNVHPSAIHYNLNSVNRKPFKGRYILKIID